LIDQDRITKYNGCLSQQQSHVKNRAADRLKILIVINRTIKMFNHD